MPSKSTAPAGGALRRARDDDDTRAAEPVDAAAVAHRRRLSTRAKTIALLLAGVAMAAGVIYYVGVGDVAVLLQSLGWSAPLILLPYAVLAVLDVIGWRRVLSLRARSAVSFWRLYWIRIAGEAVSSLTPTAGFGGEPVKAYLLKRDGVSTVDGVASVVIARGALISAQILFTLMGLVMLLEWLDLLRDRAFFMIGGCAIGLGIVVLIVVGQRRGLVAGCARLLRRIGVRGRFLARMESRAADIDHALIGFYRDDPRGFLTATAFHFAAWVFGTVEVVFFLYLMGIPCTWHQALIVESVTQATMVSGAVVPGGLGFQEASGAVLCRIVGISEAGGVAMMLLKRARELLFSLFGLGLLSHFARHRPADE